LCGLGKSDGTRQWEGRGRGEYTDVKCGIDGVGPMRELQRDKIWREMKEQREGEAVLLGYAERTTCVLEVERECMMEDD
jgi:hypothetical protein